MNAPVKINDTAVIPEGDIHVRMVEILRGLDAIGKNARNQAQGFNYRGIDDVYNAINPLLAKHGVFMTAEVVSKSREERTNAKGTVLAFTSLRMRYRFYSSDGTWVTTEAEGEGMDSGDKSSNKAMAVAHKYALLQAFCVPTKDMDDPDAHSHEVAAKTAPAQMRQPQAAPTDGDDADVVEGVKNWVAKQKATIDACERIPDLYMWADENCLGGTPGDPDTGSILYRLMKKAPEAHKEIVKYYQAKFEALGKTK